jgi:hypothetical protein
MEDDSILEPLKEYKELAEKCHANAGTFFDQLVAQSKMVEKDNCDTCDNYYSLMNSYQLALKKAGGAVAAKVLLIILDVLLFVAAFFMIWMTIASGGDQVRLIVGVVLGIVFIILGVLDILLLVKKISKLVKDRKAKAAALKAEADHELEVAKNQMAPLNALFDWGMQADVIKMTTPTHSAGPELRYRQVCLYECEIRLRGEQRSQDFHLLRSVRSHPGQSVPD